jgi:hypothetical protein
MSLTLAALIYRPSEVSDRALSLGFAIALGGWDVRAPRLQIVGLQELPGFAAAFYSSGSPRDEEAEHVIDLFEEELSPPGLVLDVVEMLRGQGGKAGGDPDDEEEGLSPLYALVYAEDFVHDEGWRVTEEGFQRRFVRDGEDGVEVGVESGDDSHVEVLDLDVPEGATEAEEQALFDAAVRPHRGATFLSGALGKNVLSVLTRASFDVERTVPVRLVPPDAEAIGNETMRLVEVLGRTTGRGGFSPPATASGAAPPAAVEAFARAYDWHDPRDPEDLYRELSIGAVTGNLRFLREGEMAAFRQEEGWKLPVGDKLYPVAKMVPSALGGGGAGRGEGAILAVGADGDSLFRLRPGRPVELAGPTFGELLRYLSLGWSKRSAVEEDYIGALMLRARLRVEAAGPRM